MKVIDVHHPVAVKVRVAIFHIVSCLDNLPGAPDDDSPYT